MSVYDYREAVKQDVLDFIEEEIDYKEFKSIDELKEDLNKTLWDADGVTGNASGSYTFSRWRAEENLCHNLDLLWESLAKFECGTDYLKDEGAEAADVTIRCYLLNERIEEALKEIEADFNAAH